VGFDVVMGECSHSAGIPHGAS